MRLVGNDAIAFQNRAHFRAVAAQTIRRTLKDHVCPESETNEGTGDSKFSLTAVEGCNPTTRDDDLLDLDQAPTKLAGADPRAARVVELRFFVGLQENEVAEALGVSLITVKRDWKVTHAWLVNRLTKRQG